LPFKTKKMKLEKHPNAQALIFDMDGTLTDSLPVHLATWHQVCAHYKCWFNEQIIVELTGSPTIRFAERVIADNNMQGVHETGNVLEKCIAVEASPCSC